MNNIKNNIEKKIKIDLKAWTIKGIEIETRIAVQKAAKKEGMTLGKYCNTKLREASNNTLKSNSTISIKSEEVKDEVRTQINALKEELSLIVKSAIEEAKPKQKSFLKRIFE